MIFRVSIKGAKPWRKSIVAESEWEARKEAVRRFRKERAYEPRADQIYVAPDINQYL
jgi:hypothetical protein